ncbi:hypothetical protein C2E21_6800 [Chlorella sorokiniana]|uniref:DUF6816 domain-containing protein n=1 Tax=Chlorella sorokiniana TaxID=3076 RepID=A0A2P6TK33_CHLSO|nr:hypothetical protein C2E21_6800 [Chlorella sorokiniana]|eukprot:PRW44443.1 hypothetical protein C2E21_6800 [Chlorella sorokiniana]
MLGSLAALHPAAAWGEGAVDVAAQGAAPKPGSLAARIATQGNVQQPGIQPPWAPKQLFYPRFMFGEWQVDMEFTGVRTPLGRQFVPPGFLQAAEAPAEEGGLGSRYSFRQRFYSTLPPTLDNELRVNLGLGMPQDAIVCDRAFNTKENTNAFLGYDAVESVEYDPRDAPLRETVTLSRLAPDMAPLPPRRLELYINHLSSEEGLDGSFLTSELCRQVLLGVRQVEVKDYEIMHEYRLQPDGSILGRQRSCLYLQPQEPRFFEAGGRAVAMYDYAYTMRRVPPPEDAPTAAVACVLTPKSVWQCV